MRTTNTTSLSRTLKAVFIFIALLALPTGARAAVSINEVMYNPAGTDSGREWVELYNSGDTDITLVGGSGKGSWRLADSSNHTLTDPQGGVGRGALVVPAGGYLVVSSDPSAFVADYPEGAYSVIKASLSLNNTGVTISLIDGSGTVVDSFSYTNSMGGNDDTTSLQKSNDTWLQALPTPGAANATESYTPPAAQTSDSGSSSHTTTSNPGYVAPPLPQLFADAGGSRSVIVGADSKFVATAYDRDKAVINYAKFLWNFGDGTTAEGPLVMHHFSYPGRYAVGLTIQNDARTSSARITVTAQPASVAIAVLQGGGVSLRNLSGRDLDVSFWKVVEGEQAFVLPEHSVVLTDASINIAASTLGFVASAQAQLRYPDNTEVQDLTPQNIATTTTAASAPAEPVQKIVAVPKKPAQATTTIVTMADIEVAVATSTPEATTTATTTAPTPFDVMMLPAAAAASAAEDRAPFPLWASTAGLGGVVGLGVMSVWYARRPKGSAEDETDPSAEEFTIE